MTSFERGQSGGVTKMMIWIDFLGTKLWGKEGVKRLENWNVAIYG